MAVGTYDPATAFETPEIEPTYKALAQTMPAHRIRRMAMDVADHYGIPRDMFLGLHRAESSWNPVAKNPKSSATGLSQFIDGTAAMYFDEPITGDDNDPRYHPGKSLDASARYLLDLKKQHGSWQKALWYYGERTEAYMHRIREAADQEINEPLPLPETWGKVLSHGWKTGAAGIYNFMANFPHVLNVLRLAGGPDFGKPPDVPELGLEYEHPFEQAERFLREKAMEVAPRPEEMPISIPGKIVSGVAAAPSAIARYAPFMSLFGTIGGFAASDAFNEIDKGLMPAIEAAVKGAVTGVGFKAVEPLAYLSRLLGLGGIGAMQAAMDGGGPEEISASAATLMALGATSRGGGVTGRQALKDAFEQFKPRWDVAKQRAQLVADTERFLTEMAARGQERAYEVEVEKQQPAIEGVAKAVSPPKIARPVQPKPLPGEETPPVGALARPGYELDTKLTDKGLFVNWLETDTPHAFRRGLKEVVRRAEQAGAQTVWFAPSQAVKVGRRSMAELMEKAGVKEGEISLFALKQRLGLEPRGIDPNVYRLPINDLKLAPEEFQYKLHAEEKTGAGLALRDVKKWDEGLDGVITAWQDKEGNTFVVNGHQRRWLAEKLGVRQLSTRVLKEADGWTKQDARAYGALINIAEGRGTEIDAAKFMRDMGFGPEDLAKKGISLTEIKTRRAVALSRLSDPIFQYVVVGRFDPEKAVIIGEGLPDHIAAQDALFKSLKGLIRGGKDITNEQLREMVRLGRGAPVIEGKQETLFGKETIEKSLLLEKASLIAYGKRRFREDKSVFALLGKKKERIEEAGKNVLDPETNQYISQNAAEALDFFNKVAYLADSRSNAVLNDYAGKLAGAKKNEVAPIRTSFYKDLKEALRADAAALVPGSRLAGSDRGRGPAAGRVGEGRPPEPAPGLETLEVDPERLAQVRRAVPNIDPAQAEILAADPELFNQVMRGNISAFEAAKIADAKAAAAQEPQRAFEGMGEGLFGFAPEAKPEAEKPPAKKPRSSDGDIILSSGLNIEQFKLLSRVAQDAVDSALEAAADYIPPAAQRRIDMNGVVKYITLPKTIAEKHPEFQPFYNAWLKKQDTMTAESLKAWNHLKTYYDLKSKSRARVDHVLRDMDQANSEAEYLEVKKKGAEFYRARKGLNPQEAEAAWRVRQYLDYAKDRLMAKLNEPHQEYLTGHGLEEARAREMLERIAHTNAPLMEPDPMTGAVGGIIGEYFGPNPMGWPRNIGRHLQKYRDHMHYWLKEANNYVPHEFRGPHFLYVKDKATGDLVDVYAAEWWHRIKKKEAEARSIYGDTADYIHERKERLPMELFMEAEIPKTRALLEAASSKLGPETREAMLEAWQDFLAQKGWGAHFIRRKGYAGYEKDLAGPLARYASGLTGYLSKMDMVRDFAKAWEGVEFKKPKPNLLRYINDYTDYLLSSPREFGRTRNLLYNLTLGGDLTFYFVNALQNIHTGWAVLGKVAKFPLPKLGKAYADWTQYVTRGAGLTETEAHALEEARQSAMLQPQFARETTARAYSPLYQQAFARETMLGRSLERVRDVPGLRTSAAYLRAFWYGDGIERMNRETMFLAAFRQTGSVQEALKLLETAHFNYGRGSRMEVGRGVGALLTQFQNFSFNYFKLWKDSLKVGDVPAMSRLLAGALVTGGLLGSFLGAPVKYAYKKAFGKDPEEEAKKYFQEAMGEVAGEELNRAIWRGIPAAALGIDISGRIAPNLPMGLDRLPPGEKDWKDYLTQALGASTMLLKKGFMATEAASKGDYYRSLEYLSPRSLQNALAAYRLSTRGATTWSGRPIYTKEFEPLKLTPGETLRKALGAQPIRVSEHYAHQEYLIQMEAARREVLDKVSTRLAWGLQTGDADLVQQAVADLGDYNRTCIEQGRFADMITPRAIDQAVNIRMKPKLPETAQKIMMREAQ